MVVLKKLAMVVLFAQILCPKFNATMSFQSCIEFLMVACSYSTTYLSFLEEIQLNMQINNIA
jgi:hypothetical protein